MIRGRWKLLSLYSHRGTINQSLHCLHNRYATIQATAIVLVRKFMKGTREQIIIMIETENVISFLYRLFIYCNITIHSCSTNIKNI